MSDVVVQLGDRLMAFRHPKVIMQTDSVGDVVPMLVEVEALVNRHNLTAAGFVGYEAAAAFDTALTCFPATPTPLLWFGLYENGAPFGRNAPSGGYHLGTPRLSLTATTFAQRIALIKAAITRGETYQVNFTFPVTMSFEGDPLALFFDLLAAQQGRYGAYIRADAFAICSASPELFFALEGNLLTTQPMKGTVARGLTLAADRANMAWLRHSEKNRAENVMIVDMIRNDLGRIARTGSVRVDNLFQVTRYPTLHQMTSDVSAETDASLVAIFRALFPCASITGAPKVRTMQLIHALETQPRGVYTGAIGIIAPNRRAQFSVAIRTAVIDQQRQTATYHVGSGIVWDSDAAEEFDECQLKAQVLTVRRPPFELLESLLFEPDNGLFLLPYHLDRLADSAEYFGITLDLAELRRRLQLAVAPLTTRTKLRVLVAQSGTITVETAPLAPQQDVTPLTLGLAAEPIYSDNQFLYHKTTYRPMYDNARAACPDCDDVILWNEHGEVTETSRGNLLFEIDGDLVTPPVTSGLLAGTYRAHLLDRGIISERVVHLDDIDRADRIWMINSVRGQLPCRLRTSQNASELVLSQ
ncbi:MAG: aminodeoxychorismate synthase component I [Anaerolineae bacterium]|nr:aminodeoxychorismate synthase component I [Anaerolineae bacterium]